jgi:hypothetical protein
MPQGTNYSDTFQLYFQCYLTLSFAFWRLKWMVYLFLESIGCSFKLPLKVGIEESIVNALLL